jgi:hypothetical protein
MAVKLLEHVVAMKKKTLAEEHPDRLATQHDLAIAYKADRQRQRRKLSHWSKWSQCERIY